MMRPFNPQGIDTTIFWGVGANRKCASTCILFQKTFANVELIRYSSSPSKKSPVCNMAYGS